MNNFEKIRSREDLETILSGTKGRGYKAYRDLKGRYDFVDFVLLVDHVQSDPFAAPSRFRALIQQNRAGFPEDTFKNISREIGLRDFLTRQFARWSKEISRGNRGTGKSGLISIDTPGQEVLERTAVLIGKEYIEVRFVVGLPARGRTVLTNVAESMLIQEIPGIIGSSMFYHKINKNKLYTHIETVEDADFIRKKLPGLGLISFIADGAVLPRASGIDGRPLRKGKIVPFKSPSSMNAALDPPNHGPLTGMGIREGITLIVGGGYHGKSTLLDAVKLGIYNHIPGDGREFVVTVQDAVMIRAEDGRRIDGVDISPFITNLPYGQDTKSFCTDNASGSTSQAASIIETLEVRTRAVLIDEDTSATNFMIRDRRMQELISKDLEPITPFIDKVRQLYRDHGVSTVLVIGGSGDYFDIADHVISMKEYIPGDCTSDAKAIAEKHTAERKREGGDAFGLLGTRIPLKESFDPSRGKRDVKISSKGLLSIVFGTHDIDLGALEQLVDMSQTRAIGDAIHYAGRYMDNKKTLKEVIDLVMSDIRKSGLDALSEKIYGDYAAFRNQDLASAINRLRTLKVIQEKQ